MAEDWSPEKEREEDPSKLNKEAIELQRESVQISKEILRRAKEEEDRKKKAAEEVEQRVGGQLEELPGVVGIPYKRPSLGEVSARCKRIWEEVQRIVPDAPELVKVTIFQALLSSDIDDSA